MDYTMPIGIPDPIDHFEGFDPIRTDKPNTVTHCPAWHEATPKDNTKAGGYVRNAYYVDNRTGTNVTYGNPASPRATLPAALSAGDYVEIHGDGDPDSMNNPYTLATSWRLTGVGTAANPIWIVGVNSPAVTAALDFGYWSSSEISYIVIDGLHWRAGFIDIRPRYASNHFHHIVFRNGSFDGKLLRTGIAVGRGTEGNASYATNDIIFYSFDVYNCGDPTNPFEECGYYLRDDVTRMWVLNCEIHHMAEDGVAGGHYARRTSSGYYIGRNHIHDNSTNGIDLKQLGDIVISENIIHGHRQSNPGSTGAGENIVLHYSDPNGPLCNPRDSLVIANEIYDGDWGVSVSVAQRVRIIGNLIHDIHHSVTPWSPGPTSGYTIGTAIQFRYVGCIMICHNTIVRCDNGIVTIDTAPPAYSADTIYYYEQSIIHNGVAYYCIDDNAGAGISGIAPPNAAYWICRRHQIWGNIIADRTEATGTDIHMVNTSVALSSTMAMDYNLIYAAGGERIYYGNTTARTVDWLQANTTLMANGLHTDPMFVDSANNNYTLQESSPAIDAATEGPSADDYPESLTAYADFEANDNGITSFGLAIRYDNALAVRPANTLWDMGALEYGSTPPITANTSSRIRNQDFSRKVILVSFS